MNKLDIIYYLGVFGLISAVIMIMVTKFREYDEINFEEHITMIIIYIILLVLAIILWRLFFNFFFGFADILNQDNIDYERILNG